VLCVGNDPWSLTRGGIEVSRVISNLSIVVEDALEDAIVGNLFNTIGG